MVTMLAVGLPPDGYAKAEWNRKNLEEIIWKTQRRAFLASSM